MSSSKKKIREQKFHSSFKSNNFEDGKKKKLELLINLKKFKRENKKLRFVRLKIILKSPDI